MTNARPESHSHQSFSSSVLLTPVDIGTEASVSENSNVRKFSKERASCEHIKSWAGVTRGLDALDINHTMNSLNALKFEIVSARVNLDDMNDKHVAYTLMVTLAGGEEDANPAIIERRYSEFLSLYQALKQAFPELFNSVQFPRKVLLGNFSPVVISERRAGFEQLLEIIGSTSQLRNFPAVIDFLQRKELSYALKLIDDVCFVEACHLIENSFRITNKLQTDRSLAVLRNLCLLVCLEADLGRTRALEYASLAVRRFQGVSDADLLRYYVPLLNIAMELSRIFDKGTAMTNLQEHLFDMRQRGVALNDSTHLLKLLLDDLRPILQTD